MRFISAILFLHLFIGGQLKAQEEGFFGGFDLGVSLTHLNIDSSNLKSNVSPLIGFSFQKRFVGKLYGGIGLSFTQKNSTSLSPSFKYRLNFIDWKASVQYRIHPNFFLEGGAAISQFIGGKIKYSNDSIIDQKENFTHQVNPYVGLKYHQKKYTLSVKYYTPYIISPTDKFSKLNQFSYGEFSINIPFSSKVEEGGIKEDVDKVKAEKSIKELKSGILLIALSGSSTKKTEDVEVDKLISEAFKNYTFSKYFIVDKKDLDQLRSTNEIEVYENYPFVEKQNINLENFSWYIAEGGKQVINLGSDEKSESYKLKSIVIYDNEGVRLPSPFPSFVNYSKSTISKSIEVLNVNLERYYYQSSFGL